MRKPVVRIIGALAAVVCLAALVAAVLSAGPGGRDWDTLELSLGDNPTTLDPALIKDVAGGRIAALLYPNLVRFDSDGSLVGDLAARWEVSADGLTYTFHLRPGAEFSDGTRITAHDVAASFERALSPEVASPRAWVLTGIKGAAEFHSGAAPSIAGLAAMDEATLRVTLEKSSGTFLALLTMPSAAVLPAETPRAPFWGVDDFPTAGGPFRVARLEPDVSLLLESNPRYYGARAGVRRIRYRVIRNPFAVVTEFRQGRLDIIEIPDAFDRFFLDDPKWAPQIDSIEGLNIYYLGFNCTKPPFDGREFRRAVCAAVDRRAIIDNVLHGKASSAVGPVPPGLEGYDPDLKGPAVEVDAARGAIAAGAGGRTFLLLVLANADTMIVAQALAGQLKAAGLSVEVAPREKGTFKATLRDGEFDMVYYSWVADYPDASTFMEIFF